MPLELRIVKVVSPLFMENAYLAWLPGRDEGLLFDPGENDPGIIAACHEAGVRPAAVVITHGHGDHIAGVMGVLDQWPDCRLVIGAGDAAKLTDPRLNLSAALGIPVVARAADVLVREGESFSTAGVDLLVHEIPGHSIGHVVFVWQAGSPWVVFGGDVLFAGSIGRTDFPDGDFQQLAAGIRRHLYSLPDETIVLPGHGPATTVGHEKRTNPFVSGE